MFEPDQITFRRLSHADLPLMHMWLSSGDVLRWYGQRPSSYDEVVQKYSRNILGEQPTASFLIVYDDTPVGYIQTYMIDSYPIYAQFVAAGATAAGVDIFIGEDDYRHHGLGSAILAKFVREVVFGALGASICIIGPEPKNTVAIRAYEKAGFRYWKTIHIPGESEPEYLMRLRCEELPHDWPKGSTAKTPRHEG
jgi:aminoglycoside 6'-N-acetyltransferase